MEVYFEETGRGMGYVTIHAYVGPLHSGHGYMFALDGHKYEFAWAHPDYVFEHTQLPKELWYSIRHGSCYMKIKESKKGKWKFADLVYDKIERAQIRAVKMVYRKIGDVNSIDDFKKLYPYIKKCGYYIPEVVDKLFELCEAYNVPIINGEMGIAYFQQCCIYKALLKELGIE